MTGFFKRVMYFVEKLNRIMLHVGKKNLNYKSGLNREKKIMKEVPIEFCLEWSVFLFQAWILLSPYRVLMANEASGGLRLTSMF